MRRTEKFLSVLMVMAVVIPASCADEEDHWHPPLGYVTGTVFEKGTAVAIDSAVVSGRFVPDTASAPFSVDTTDSAGWYRLLPGYYEGPIYVRAEKNGFIPSISEIHFTEYDSVMVNIELEKR